MFTDSEFDSLDKSTKLASSKGTRGNGDGSPEPGPVYYNTGEALHGSSSQRPSQDGGSAHNDSFTGRPNYEKLQFDQVSPEPAYSNHNDLGQSFPADKPTPHTQSNEHIYQNSATSASGVKDTSGEATRGKGRRPEVAMKPKKTSRQEEENTYGNVDVQKNPIYGNAD